MSRYATIEEAQNEFEYQYCKVVPDRGTCGLQRQFATVGLFYGIDYSGCYAGRYCFKDAYEALIALALWEDGNKDPEGMWIKHKGRFRGKSYDDRNPLLNETETDINEPQNENHV